MCDARTEGPGPEPVSLAGWLAARPFVVAIRLYQLTLRGLLGNQCRFMPTCSAYGLEAYERHGPLRGTALTVWRVLRCQPLCRGGFDPVPARPTRRERRGRAAVCDRSPASGP